eukprot:5396718-Pyramimonas_sp.AAC.1
MGPLEPPQAPARISRGRWAVHPPPPAPHPPPPHPPPRFHRDPQGESAKAPSPGTAADRPDGCPLDRHQGRERRGRSWPWGPGRGPWGATRSP